MAPRTSSKPSRSGFKYTPRDEKSLKERAEQTGGRFDSPFKEGIDMYRAKVGDNLFRILPPTWDNHDHYGYDIWIHSYVGADNSAYLCPNKMQSKPCPICDAAREAKQAGEEDDAKQLAVTRRVVCWVIDRDDDTAAPKLFSMSWSQDRDIAALCTNKRTGKILLIDHPDEGYDVTIKRQGQGLKTKYFGIAVDREPSPILDEVREQEKILEYIQENPIPSILKFYPLDYLKKMISGTADSKDEDLDEEESSESDNEEREARSSHSSKPSRRAEPDEDDIEEATDEEEETTTRKPSRFRDEDEADTEEAEEKSERRPTRRRNDDEEAPPPRRASSKRDRDEEEELPFGDDDPPARTKRGRDPEDEEDAPPPKRRSAPKDEAEEDEKPARRGTKPVTRRR